MACETASIAFGHMETFSTAKEEGERAMPLRVRRILRSHEIMIPRSGGEGRNVNSRKADEVFAEHGFFTLASGVRVPGSNPGRTRAGEESSRNLC